MTTTEQRLADALRTIDEHCQTGLNSSVYSHWSAALEDAMRVSREALAAYDAQRAATWTEDDDSVATSEGWLVSRTSDGFHEIQKVDDADVFTEDTQAIAHVYWMAGTGSEVHKRAIAYTLRDGNEWTYTQASIASRAKRCEHIRMCVNAHDTLVSALRTILADKGSASFNDDLEAYDAAIQTASDALAQAGVNHA